MDCFIFDYILLFVKCFCRGKLEVVDLRGLVHLGCDFFYFGGCKPDLVLWRWINSVNFCLSI